MSTLNQIYKAIKRLTQQPEPAMERAKQLSELTDLSRYSPATVARSTTFSPAAQRGFSESLVSSRAPFGATLLRPSEWAYRTPALDFGDERIVQGLQRSIAEKGLKEAPVLWFDQYPTGIDAGYEGRHRMEALKRLYGDDPVLVNLIMGDRFRHITDSPYYPKGTVLREYEGPLTGMSPLELIKQRTLFGETPIEINPLWTRE